MAGESPNQGKIQTQANPNPNPNPNPDPNPDPNPNANPNPNQVTKGLDIAEAVFSGYGELGIGSGIWLGIGGEEWGPAALTFPIPNPISNSTLPLPYLYPTSPYLYPTSTLTLP